MLRSFIFGSRLPPHHPPPHLVYRSFIFESKPAPPPSLPPFVPPPSGRKQRQKSLARGAKGGKLKPGEKRQLRNAKIEVRGREGGRAGDRRRGEGRGGEVLSGGWEEGGREGCRGAVRGRRIEMRDCSVAGIGGERRNSKFEACVFLSHCLVPPPLPSS